MAQQSKSHFSAVPWVHYKLHQLVSEKIRHVFEELLVRDGETDSLNALHGQRLELCIIDSNQIQKIQNQLIGNILWNVD